MRPRFSVFSMVTSWLRNLAGGVHANSSGLRSLKILQGTVVVICSSPNATVDYFVKAELTSIGKKVVLASPDEFMAGSYAAEAIVIVRYLPAFLIRPLERYRFLGGKVIYFMDDDLMDKDVLCDLPLTYAKKILAQATKKRKVLEELCCEFWVSSAFLASKYSCWNPRIISPRPGKLNLCQVDAVRICYHGSAAHEKELRWLVPIVERVLAANPNVVFQVFGDNRINKLFRHIPGVFIVHPMSWPSYMAYTGKAGQDIALAPLLPCEFNLGRSPTKFFDFARIGAVGVYSNVEPYRTFVRSGVDGVLLSNDADLWVSTLRELIADVERRKRLVQAAYARALSLTYVD